MQNYIFFSLWDSTLSIHVQEFLVIIFCELEGSFIYWPENILVAGGIADILFFSIVLMCNEYFLVVTLTVV